VSALFFAVAAGRVLLLDWRAVAAPGKRGAAEGGLELLEALPLDCDANDFIPQALAPPPLLPPGCVCLAVSSCIGICLSVWVCLYLSPSTRLSRAAGAEPPPPQLAELGGAGYVATLTGTAPFHKQPGGGGTARQGWVAVKDPGANWLCADWADLYPQPVHRRPPPMAPGPARLHRGASLGRR
jgi:hypothetical protein